MRKIYLFLNLSIDGYFEGPNHDLSWHKVDKEFNKFAITQLNEADLIIFGRRTYQLMESFWPKAQDDPTISKEDLIVAKLMNNKPKIVISRTLKKVQEQKNWKNVKLMNKFDPKEIIKLKRQKGNGIWVGGSDLAVSFIKSGLIDEFRFMIMPVAIGKGTPLFKKLGRRLNLKLVKTQRFKSGNMLLYYRSPKLGK
ncbi:MAG: dihydrofolate reductase [Candidatus Micrarchaeota archaeon]|nr:dihydrofolate reductase [Candidatus Micrarchaeota archaeon]